MKALIGLGSSWTTGVGSVPDNKRAKDYPCRDICYNWYHKTSLETSDVADIELNASWVKKLSKKLNARDFNLSISGQGNRAAVKCLYLSDISWKDISQGYLVFMLTGRNRFDISYRFSNDVPRPFVTFCPCNDEKLDNWWFQNIQNDEQDNLETLLTILEAQTYADAHNLEFYFCFSTDDCSDLKDNSELSKKINWNRCITLGSNFFKILADSQDTSKDLSYYFQLTESTELISKCSHPTEKGYEFIADYIFNFIKNYDKSN